MRRILLYLYVHVHVIGILCALDEICSISFMCILSIFEKCLRCIDKREVIVDIDNDSLAHGAGIEKWDILEELCGAPVHAIKPNSVSVVAFSMESLKYMCVSYVHVHVHYVYVVIA